MIQGHMQFELHRYLNNNFRYFSIMRDTIKHVLSQYTYNQNLQNDDGNISTDFSEDDIEFVKGKNKLNIQLYKYATEFFNEIINDLPNGFQNELNQFNRNNKFRAAFYAMPRFKRRFSRLIG